MSCCTLLVNILNEHTVIFIFYHTKTLLKNMPPGTQIEVSFVTSKNVALQY
jgi:hypothetical protein